MRALLIAAVVTLVSCTAGATTLKDFEAMPEAKKGDAIVGFIDKMTTDLRAQNEPLASKIRNWFAVKPAGKATSEGMERLYVELTVIERQAAAGKADLSKIQLEGVIVFIVKEKFPPVTEAHK
jgi:hypothetical protein